MQAAVLMGENDWINNASDPLLGAMWARYTHGDREDCLVHLSLDVYLPMEKALGWLFAGLDKSSSVEDQEKMLRQALSTQTVNDANLPCAYFTPNWLPSFCMSKTDILLSYSACYAPSVTASIAPEGDRFIENSFETESHKLSPLPQSINSDLSSWPCTTANIIACDYLWQK